MRAREDHGFGGRGPDIAYDDRGRVYRCEQAAVHQRDNCYRDSAELDRGLVHAAVDQLAEELPGSFADRSGDTDYSGFCRGIFGCVYRCFFAEGAGSGF